MKLHDEEIRIIGLGAPTILKMLDAREKQILGRIYGEWRAGKLDQIQALSEFACNRDLINEITRTLAVHHRSEEIRHADPSNARPDNP